MSDAVVRDILARRHCSPKERGDVVHGALEVHQSVIWKADGDVWSYLGGECCLHGDPHARDEEKCKRDPRVHTCCVHAKL